MSRAQVTKVVKSAHVQLDPPIITSPASGANIKESLTLKRNKNYFPILKPKERSPMGTKEAVPSKKPIPGPKES